MFRAVFLSPNKPPVYLNTMQDIRLWINSPDGFLWVSLENASDNEITTILTELYNFHPLAIEDCQSPGYQTSKIDDYSDYIFIIAHAINPTKEIARLDTLEVNLFLGINYLVTCHTDLVVTPIQQAWDLLVKDTRISKNGADFLCHTILDLIVDDYMPIVDKLERDVELVEDIVLEKPSPEILHRLLELKHGIIELREIMAPQREVLNRLSRDEFPQIDSKSLIYYRDIYDHIVRIQNLTDIIRDIVSGALDIYLNSTNLRLNEIMKALTIVSTIFLPLSFITGAFGMNFLYIPGASNRLGFYITCFLLVLLGAGMLIYFRKRHWY